MGALDYLRSELDDLETQGLRIHPRVLQAEQKARTTFDGEVLAAREGLVVEIGTLS